MRGLALLPVLALVSSLAVTAHAQQAPLTPLPPPPPPPAAPPPVPPPPAPPEPPTFEAPSAPTTVSIAPMPPPPRPPEYGPPPPIACTGPGTFTHDGFYARFLTEFGFLGAHATGLGQSISLHGAGSGGGVALGGTPSEGFVVGGLIRALTVEQPSSTGLPSNLAELSTAELAPFVDWYPSEHRGWHVGGSLGLGLASIKFTGATSWVGASVGGGAFGGYDFWIGPQWSLGIQGSLSFTTAAKLQEQQSGNETSTGYSIGSFGGTIGVALVYH